MIGEDVLLFSSVRELGEGLRARRFTSVDLTEGYLARLEALGPSLGAVVTITRELALEQARAKGLLLAPAHRYQQSSDWHRRRPSLDRLPASARERGFYRL